MKKIIICVLTQTVVLLAVSRPLMASPVLDQFQLDGTEQNQAIHSTRDVGQTFTVGIAGLLASIELSLFESGSGGDLTVEILDMSAGSISTAPILGSVAIPETALGPSPTTLSSGSTTATLIELSSLGIGVDVGDVLAFRLTSTRILEPPTNIYAIRTAVFSDLYGGGAYFVGNTFIEGDAAFKTFVTVTAVPEPTTLLLMAIGLAGIAATRQRLRAYRNLAQPPASADRRKAALLGTSLRSAAAERDR